MVINSLNNDIEDKQLIITNLLKVKNQTLKDVSDLGKLTVYQNEP